MIGEEGSRCTNMTEKETKGVTIMDMVVVIMAVATTTIAAFRVAGFHAVAVDIQTQATCAIRVAARTPILVKVTSTLKSYVRA